MRGLVVSFLAGAVLLFAMATVFPTWLVIAIGVWALVLLFAVVLCVAAGRSDRMWDEARARELAQERKAIDDIYGEER